MRFGICHRSAPRDVRARWASRTAVTLLLWSAAACASGAAPATTPTAVPSPRPPVSTPAPTAPTETSPTPATRGAAPPPSRESAPANWHRLDLEQDGVMGVGSERAIRELLAGRQPQRKIVVAVIDGGVDTAHTLLAPNLFRKPREIAGNGKDDDGNGYVDDVYGWNYIGGANGKDVQYDTFELTRLYAACRSLPAGVGTPKPDAARCGALAKDFADKRREIGGTLGQIDNLAGMLSGASRVLQEAIPDSLTPARVRAYRPPTSALNEAKLQWLQLADNGLTESELVDAKKAYETQFRYGLDTMFNPRSIVGDESRAPLTAPYGNRDVTGPDALHGTHVTGIIGARRDRGGDVQGIAPNVEIMAIRAVPDGDERDTDVANAIRYAADNGANIINMSFGKAYSPRKAAVDSAVRYAESKGVLLVHAAGNESEDNDAGANFPSATLASGERPRTWIEVGASSWKGGGRVPATFSNYGRSSVDLFAPGEDILSTTPNGQTAKESGTSMAAPVVSGVAALIMTYFPSMTAVDVKELLVSSARALRDLDVTGPGEMGRVKFGALSRSGGVVDAYAAVKAALARNPVP